MHLDNILSSIDQARTTDLFNQMVDESPDAQGSNEFLFFIKPELLLDTPGLDTRQIMAMIFEKITAFDLTVKNARVLSAGYLSKHGIIAQHYGVINQIARDVQTAASDGAKQTFESIFGEPFSSAPVLGGLEIIARFPELSAVSLDYLWQNTKAEKLAGGTYASSITLDGEAIYLVNGFHPRQLEHFTQPGRCIVALTLTGDISWKEARQSLIGATAPDAAQTGSIRRTLLDNMEAYGLKAVNSSWNGVHLSAGPIEALTELIRYQSDFEQQNILTAEDFSFGRDLVETFGAEKTASILANPNVETADGAISVFDLTEEKNTAEALELLQDSFSA
ncbi:hypothetical protein [Oceaniferula marina]|nr:hypothetical protein [Oceaniferula marina]